MTEELIITMASIIDMSNTTEECDKLVKESLDLKLFEEEFLNSGKLHSGPHLIAGNEKLIGIFVDIVKVDQTVKYIFKKESIRICFPN
jgi:hypothetical protein